jgi:hypothetical protein
MTDELVLKGEDSMELFALWSKILADEVWMFDAFLD